MKKLFAAVVCAMFLAVTAAAQQPAACIHQLTAEPAQTAIAPPLHPITREQTKELFQVAGVQSDASHPRPPDDHARRRPMRRSGSLPPSTRKWKKASWEIDFGALLYPTYAKYLSEEDAAKVIAFYRTPEGQHFVQVTPFVMSEAGKIGQRKASGSRSRYLPAHQQELLDAKTKYDTHRKQELEQMTNPAAPDSSKPAAPQK